MNDVDDYSDVQRILGHQFKDPQLLEAALTHRSRGIRADPTHAQGARKGAGDYERLEFLGDAVIDLAVAELLLERYPAAREGELSKMRAALVNTNSLAEISERLEVYKYIRLSRSESDSGGARRPGILADVLEALIGALYRDAGFDNAKKCVENIFGEWISCVTPRDPKTELQELLHTLGKSPPVYLLEAVEGPEHEPKFISLVQIDGKTIGRGRGATKKASQQMAASEALGILSPAQAQAKDVE